MTYYVGTMPVGEHLSHHGIKGMKWGQRRYQNPDGSLTAAGRMRYGVSNAYSRVRSGARNAAGRSKSWYKKNEKQIKRAAKIAGATAAVAGTAYLGARYGKSALKTAGKLARSARNSGMRVKGTISSGTRVLGGAAKRRTTSAFRSASAKLQARKINRKGLANAKKLYKETGIVNPQYANQMFNRTARGTNEKWLTRGTKRYQKSSVKGKKSRSFLTSAVNGIDERVQKGIPKRLAKNSAASRRKQFVSNVKNSKAGRKVRNTGMVIGGTARSAKNVIKSEARKKANVLGVTKTGAALRRANNSYKTAKAKAVVGAKSMYGKAKSATKNAASSVKRKAYYSRTVNDAFNSPSRYFGTHTRKQIRRDVARNLGLQVGAAYAGAGAGAYITRHKKKKTRK